MKVFPSRFPNKYLSPQYLPSYGNLVKNCWKNKTLLVFYREYDKVGKLDW